jgi:thiol:disulfide interchange protein
MVRVKQLMGFLLIATLLFLLSVLGAQRGVASLIWTCAFLLVLSVACWMKGAFITPLASAKSRVLVVLLMLLLTIGGGFYFIGDKFQNAAAVASPSSFRWRLGEIYTGTARFGTTAGSFRLHRFHRRMVHHLQIQRIDRA